MEMIFEIQLWQAFEFQQFMDSTFLENISNKQNDGNLKSCYYQNKIYEEHFTLIESFYERLFEYK